MTNKQFPNGVRLNFPADTELWLINRAKELHFKNVQQYVYSLIIREMNRAESQEQFNQYLEKKFGGVSIEN